MNRPDALKVWEDLTRELWPEADVEKSALRIEHQRHVDLLLENTDTTDGYGSCSACGIAFNTFGHATDCPLMEAWEALDHPLGHKETGRAWDEGSGWNRAAYTAQDRASGLGEWVDEAAGATCGFPSQEAWEEYVRGMRATTYASPSEGIEAAVIRAAGLEVGFPAPSARIEQVRQLLDNGYITPEQASALLGVSSE